MRQSQRMEAVGQLTGGIAHDFNNLLTVILGNSELLADGLGDNPDLRKLAMVTLSAAERGADLTQGLLAFSRRQMLDPKSVDINQLLTRLVPMLQRTIDKHVEIIILPAPDLWRALIDAPRLEAAVLNLCINAQHAMPHGGRMVIETANTVLDADYVALEDGITPGPYIMVAVTDTGTGMTPEVTAQAFEPFFTTKEVGQGSGLGLSMVHGFVNQSRGHVKIASEVGQGTSVRMYLPRDADQATDTDLEIASGSVPRGLEHLLLVEDDADVRAHVMLQLRALGYRVTETANGQEALAALRQPEHFDLLFTDVMMPGGIDGWELGIQAREIRPKLPVLYTSGYSHNGNVRPRTSSPELLFLQKPYRRQELAAKIRAALRGAG